MFFCQGKCAQNPLWKVEIGEKEYIFSNIGLRRGVESFVICVFSSIEVKSLEVTMNNNKQKKLYNTIKVLSLIIIEYLENIHK